VLAIAVITPVAALLCRSGRLEEHPLRLAFHATSAEETAAHPASPATLPGQRAAIDDTERAASESFA